MHRLWVKRADKCDNGRQLTADSDPSVKNGAELLDRLLKDIVTEQAATYISVANYGEDAHFGVEKFGGHGGESGPSTLRSAPAAHAEPSRAFSLPRFLPLLYERLTVRDAWVRTFLLSWLTVLDGVPDLQVVSYLPQFLDGLLDYLGDQTHEVRTQTETVLEAFLREIGSVRRVQLELLRSKREAWEVEMERRRRRASEAKTVTVTDHDDGEREGAEGEEEEEAAEADESFGKATPTAQRTREASRMVPEAAVDDSEGEGDAAPEADEDDAGEWTPGQGVTIDYPAILEILLRYVTAPGEQTPLRLPHRANSDRLTCLWSQRRGGNPSDLPALDRRIPADRTRRRHPVHAAADSSHTRRPRAPQSGDPASRDRHERAIVCRRPVAPRRWATDAERLVSRIGRILADRSLCDLVTGHRTERASESEYGCTFLYTISDVGDSSTGTRPVETRQ